jgi:hypothetical protein
MDEAHTDCVQYSCDNDWWPEKRIILSLIYLWHLYLTPCRAHSARSFTACTEWVTGSRADWESGCSTVFTGHLLLNVNNYSILCPHILVNYKSIAPQDLPSKSSKVTEIWSRERKVWDSEAVVQEIPRKKTMLWFLMLIQWQHQQISIV